MAAKISPQQRRNIVYSIVEHLDEEDALTITEIHHHITDRGIEVDRKTIERDLNHLSLEFGIIETEDTPKKFFVSKDFTPVVSLNLGHENLQTIFLALESLKQTSPDYLQKMCIETLGVLDNLLPKSMRDILRNFRSKHHFSYGINGRSLAPDSKSLKIILQALREERSFKCKYYPLGDSRENREKNERHFAPLLFQLSGGVPYLIVKDLDMSEKYNRSYIFNLRASRIEDVKLTSLYISKEILENIESLDSSFGGYGFGVKKDDLIKYRLFCRPELATYFKEREIHSSQKIKQLDKYEYLVTFTLPESTEIIRFLKGFGKSIIKIEPAKIHDLVFNKDVFFNQSTEEKNLIIDEAIHNNIDLLFEYTDKNGIPSKRTVTPEELQIKNDNYYLKCICRTRGKERVFKLSRMKNIEKAEKKAA